MFFKVNVVGIEDLHQSGTIMVFCCGAGQPASNRFDRGIPLQSPNPQEIPMPIENWLAFVAASAVLLVIPGPTILTVISYSMAHGRRANVPLIAAVALGDSTALVVSLLGLGALLAASAFWFTVIKFAGGLYLLVLGIKLLRAGISP